VRKGLPFAATLYMNTLLGGIMARTQRDFKVTICHFLWMGNHAHFLLICKDAEAFTNFYGEIKKKLTDTLKSLLDTDHLTPWDGDTVVPRVLDRAATIRQIAYIYANPARANLTAAIEEYPLLNSYKDFRTVPSTVSAAVDHTECWVPAANVPKLVSRVTKHQRDVELTALLKKSGFNHTLTLNPNAWMECFGITEPEEVAEVNKEIFDLIREMESEYAETRRKEKKGVLGAKNLRLQPFMQDHTPARSERKIFVISSIKDLRISFIEEVKDLCEYCRECFIRSLRGYFVEWPPGMFRPSFRHVASDLDFCDECVVQ